MRVSSYYDQYWNQINTTICDARSLQRAKLAAEMMGKDKKWLLDIGCGRGTVGLFFKKLGYKVKGIDISEIAVKETLQKGIAAEICDITQTKLSGEYDIITCFEVLEHMANHLEALKNIKNALKKDSKMIISLPNEFHIIRRFKILFGIQEFGGYDNPHLRFFNEKEALRLIKDAGLKIKNKIYVSLIPPKMKLIRLLGNLLAKLFPGLFCISYIFKCSKTTSEN